MHDATLVRQPRAMGKAEIAAKCGYENSTNYFFQHYIPQNFPDLLERMQSMGYKKSMRLLPEKLANIIINEFT
jgi:hypothetical protein